MIGYLNDLWRYDVKNNTWTWVSGGHNDTYRKGVYGEMGKASSDYFPSGRNYAAGWFDIANNEIWIFGGYGYANMGESPGLCGQSFLTFA